MTDNTMLQEAIHAIRAGDKARARDLLSRLLKNAPANAEYWVWMSTVVESDKERIYCLREALQADPKNEAARRGLRLFGAMPADPREAGAPRPPRRVWPVRQAEPPKPSGPALPISRNQLLIWGGAGLLSIGLLIFGMINARLTRSTYDLPDEAPTAKASATYLPTPTPEFVTATPTYPGLPPLALMLSATYTPTPIYGATPHPLSEAYQSGLRQMERGNWTDAAAFFAQVEQSEPNAVDGYYFLGEAYRLQGLNDKALAEYAKAIHLNPDFAPPYLGQARAKLAADPKADVEDDLKQAIQHDAQYGEAYLVLSNFYLGRDDPQDALKSEQIAATIIPDDPLVYLYQAESYLAIGDAQSALTAARKANSLDLTSLDAYRVLAVAAQANQDLAGSIRPLETYLPYRPDDAAALVMAGRAYLSQGQPEKALQVYSQAIQADPKQVDALIGRGQLYLGTQQGDLALADFTAALKVSPKSFDANLGKGRALLIDSNPRDAANQLEISRGIAATDEQRAAALYWEAQALEANQQSSAAVNIWKALLALPQSASPQDWLSTAQTHLDALLTPTPADQTPGPSTTPAP